MDELKILRIGTKENEYIREVLNSQFKSSSGISMTTRVEDKFSQIFGVKYPIAFINGTATMHAALVSAGVEEGDEVIVPPLTMASTAFAVLQANATPVFADIDPLSWTIDPKSIEAWITTKTKAIIPVSIYGLSPDMDAIMDIATRYNLFVLEDDAQCFLGYYKNRIVGSIGHASSFSFQNSKHITSGEGGLILTNDYKLAAKIRQFNSLGYKAVSANDGKITKDIIQDPAYERHVSVGWNYRMPELCAAVLLGQLDHFEEIIKMRTRIANLFNEAVSSCSWLVPQLVPANYTHSYWSYVVKLDNNNVFSWYDFRNKYIECGGDGIYAAWQLTYLEPAFKCINLNQRQFFNVGLCPIAESIQPKLLQFKTNYLDMYEVHSKVDALYKTIKYFS